MCENKKRYWLTIEALSVSHHLGLLNLINMTNYQIELINKSFQFFSKYKGVWFNKKKEWRACFQAKDIKINLGPFSTEEEASKDYCEEYEKYFQKILANQK